MPDLTVFLVLLSMSQSPGLDPLPQYSWGMTPAQVATASAGAAPLGGQGGWEKPGYVVGNFGTATIGGHSFQAGFYFQNNALREIRTYRAGSCPDLKTAFDRRFGTPTTAGGWYAKWTNSTSNTELRLVHDGECRVILTQVGR